MKNRNPVILFQGDSLTDCGKESPGSLGYGYVKKIGDAINDKYPELDAVIINRGESGDRTKDLKRRWETDCIELNPDLLTILVGINDCARRYDSRDPTPLKTFEENYHELIKWAIDALPDIKIIVMEPFLLPLLKDMHIWREDLDPKIHAIRRIASNFKCGLIPLDGIMAQVAAKEGCSALTYDGVHLYNVGHSIIAKAWLDYFATYVSVNIK